MSDETYAPRTFPLPVHGELEELEIPPATGWVVHLIPATRSGLPIIWAWCKVAEDQPGYSTMVFTLDDGVTEADPGTTVHLGPVLFKVFC